METLNTPSAQQTIRQQATWRDELAQLLARPVGIEQPVSRQGSMLEVHFVPAPHADQQTIDLAVTIFFTHLPPPQPDEERADAIALHVFLRGLQQTDPQLRIAACEALGRLGHVAAKDALQHAAQEDNPHVRRAARQALTTLEAPRARRDELTGIHLTLWRQVRHLWQPLGTAITDQHGRVRFTNIPAGAGCRVQAPPQKQVLPGVFAARLFPTRERGELAAEDVSASEQTLPRSHWIALPDGNLLCTLYRNDREEIVVEFRSDAPQLQGGWVQLTIINKKTQEQALNEFVALEPDERGVLTARLVLSTSVDLQHEHEFHFVPLALLPEAE